MFKKGDIIDKKYRVDGVCSDIGGMGTLLFVSPLDEKREDQVVLKYCKIESNESIARFRREVRLMSEYQGNSKIVQLIDYNLEYDPPYFVMKYYPLGDLTGLSENIRDDISLQEDIFVQMIDCVSELHSRDQFHRDLKPTNFLRDDGDVILSDFGLSVEIDSSTVFTTTKMVWGTHGYVPPEYQHGGFKNADATGDIFMLGRSFYAILTKRDPVYLVNDNIPAPVFHVIKKCCAVEKSQRYQTLAEVKQSLISAYDVLTGRGGKLGDTRQLLSSIIERLDQERRYSSKHVAKFIENLSMLEKDDQIRICRGIDSRLFNVLKQEPVADHLSSFLDCYELMVKNEEYPWEFAEQIAKNMRIVFESPSVPNELKAKSLDLAIYAAIAMNRYAAMDTCEAMITEVADEQLALEISDIMMEYAGSFVSRIEPSQCDSDTIRQLIQRMAEEAD